MKVFVGIHEHSHGTDARVFKHEQSVWIWRERIADEWWRQEFADKPKPYNLEQTANEYFGRMSAHSEFFTIKECEVEE